ncbi:unnamed protein product [Tetraodon nigroviridis]|uniref:(spotted green pufferfish) hypothetical protein n=1 Tax=Tetraodon nigroviridis TaxID=99883 RepID=Q4TC01_TETNG|nr:unnamed protein product [Tetraodon nigroviridis]
MNGELEQAHPSGVENTVDSGAEQGVYEVEKQNSVFQIGIPYNAEGGRRKSLALDGLYEFYVFNLYVEQILLEGDQVDARLRVFRTLVTPLLPRPLFCENGAYTGTLLAERMFLAYLGDVPEDVVLVSVGLNGQEFPLQAQTLTGFTVTEVAHANNTRVLQAGQGHAVRSDDPVHAACSPGGKASLPPDFGDGVIGCLHQRFLFRLWDALHSGAPAFRTPVADHHRLRAADVRTGSPARLRPEQPQPAAAAGRAALHRRLRVQGEEPAPQTRFHPAKMADRGVFYRT